MPSNFDENILLGKWVHSHEEDTPLAMVFRPTTYPFPPSRGRSAFEFQPGGRLMEEKPGPTDRRVTTVGTWGLDDQNRLVLRLPGRSQQVFQIESLEQGRLVFKK